MQAVSYTHLIIIAFLVAILVACLQNRSLKFDQKLEIMSQGLADKNIITMLLIYLTAGAFVGVVGRSSAESVAYFMLSLIPARFAAVSYTHLGGVKGYLKGVGIYGLPVLMFTLFEIGNSTLWIFGGHEGLYGSCLLYTSRCV